MKAVDRKGVLRSLLLSIPLLLFAFAGGVGCGDYCNSTDSDVCGFYRNLHRKERKEQQKRCEMMTLIGILMFRNTDCSQATDYNACVKSTTSLQPGDFFEYHTCSEN